MPAAKSNEFRTQSSMRLKKYHLFILLTAVFHWFMGYKAEYTEIMKFIRTQLPLSFLTIGIESIQPRDK